MFVFTSSCLQQGSCLIYVICVCLNIISNTYYLVGGCVHACVRGCVFFLSTVVCLLSFFISSLSFLYQRQPLITTLVSWNFSWTQTGILTVMGNTSYDHQQTKLCHILQMIKWIYVNFLCHSFSVVGAVVVMIVWQLTLQLPLQS